MIKCDTVANSGCQTDWIQMRRRVTPRNSASNSDQCDTLVVHSGLRDKTSLFLSSDFFQKKKSKEKSKISFLQSFALLYWKYFRFRGSCTPVTVNWFLLLFHYSLQYLKTLYIVWSLVRRWVIRRLARLQTMHNVLKYIKTF